MNTIKYFFAIGSIILLGIIYNAAFGQTTYYIDPDNGVDPSTTDVNTGTDINNPVKTLNGLDYSAFNGSNKEYLIKRGAISSPVLTLSDFSNIIVNGTWQIHDNNITIGSYQDHPSQTVNPTIKSTTSASVIYMVFKHNISIENIRIVGENTTSTDNGILIAGYNSSNVSVSNCSIKGTENGIYVFIYSGSYPTMENININNCVIDMIDSPSTGCGIKINKGNEIHIKDCSILNAKALGVYIEGNRSANISISNTIINGAETGIKFWGGYFYSTEPNNIEIDNCEINMSVSSTNGRGISLDYFRDIDITNCDIYGLGGEFGILAKNSDSYGDGVEILDCTIKDPEVGIKLISIDNNSIIKKCNISDSQYGTTGSVEILNGIIIEDSKNVSIVDCYVNVKQTAMEFSNSNNPIADDLMKVVFCTIDDPYGISTDYPGIKFDNIQNCSIIDCSIYRKSEDQHCIDIQNNCDILNISGNSFYHEPISPSASANSINLAPISSVNNTLHIRNNVFRSNFKTRSCITTNNQNYEISNNLFIDARDGIRVPSGHCIIHHNIFKNCFEFGINGYGNSTLDILCNTIYRDNLTSSCTGGQGIYLLDQCTANVEGNIFYLESMGGQHIHVVGNATINTDYNAFSEFSGFIQLGSNTYNTLSAYQATTNGTHSLVFTNNDPKFTDVTINDFSLLESSQCIDAYTGLITSTYDIDYNGKTIPAPNTAADIGAFEYYEPIVQNNWRKEEPTGWYYSTSEIVDMYPNHKEGLIYHTGELAYIKGVNWYTIGNDMCELGGLFEAEYTDIIDAIKDAGFNTVRLAYSADIVLDKINSTEQSSDCILYAWSQYPQPGDNGYYPDNIDFMDYWDANINRWIGKTKFEVLEIVVNKLCSEGLNVLLSHHGIQSMDGLWYDGADFTEADYLATLEYMAQHFTNDRIIGIDIFNEPFKAKWNNSNSARNFKRFAEEAGSTVLDNNPNWLIFVEGIQYHEIESLLDEENDIDPNLSSNLEPALAYGWGESLSAANHLPIDINSIPTHKLIYSPHSYLFAHGFIQNYIDEYVLNPSGGTADPTGFYNKLTAFNDFRWGNLAENHGVIPGEFGLDLNNTYSPTSFVNLIQYLGEKKIPGSFYWSINANDHLGLLNSDWQTTNNDKTTPLRVLHGIKLKEIGNGGTLYSPRDGTSYHVGNNDFNYPEASIYHESHWVSRNGFTSFPYNVSNSNPELFSVLHEFRTICSHPLATGQKYWIQVDYSDKELGNVDENSLKMYKYENGKYVNAGPSTVWPSQNKLTFFTDAVGYNRFAVLGDMVTSQRIELLSGWSMWSTYIIPDNPNIEDIFEDVVEDVLIVKDEIGQTYWPDFGLNTIGNISEGEGYQAKMSDNTAIIVKGTQASCATTSINLPVGWSNIGYIPTVPEDIADIFDDITSSIIIIEDEVGNVYWPYYGLNLIGDMKPGEGYQINMEFQETFHFPDPSTFSKSTKQSNQEYNKSFVNDLYINTDNFMVVGIPLNSWDTIPPIGAEISAIGESSQLVGKTTFNGGFTAITIYGDDYYTQEIVENLSDEETFSIVVSSTLNKTEKTYKFKDWIEGDGNFTNREIAVVGKTVEIENIETINLDIFPNPGKGLFVFSVVLPKNQNINYEVINSNGSVICTDEFDGDKGSSEHKIDLSFLDAGSYIVRLNTNNKFISKKLIVIE